MAGCPCCPNALQAFLLLLQLRVGCVRESMLLSKGRPSYLCWRVLQLHRWGGSPLYAHVRFSMAPFPCIAVGRHASTVPDPCGRPLMHVRLRVLCELSRCSLQGGWFDEAGVAAIAAALARVPQLQVLKYVAWQGATFGHCAVARCGMRKYAVIYVGARGEVLRAVWCHDAACGTAAAVLLAGVPVPVVPRPPFLTPGGMHALFWQWLKCHGCTCLTVWMPLDGQ